MKLIASDTRRHLAVWLLSLGLLAAEVGSFMPIRAGRDDLEQGEASVQRSLAVQTPQIALVAPTASNLADVTATTSATMYAGVTYTTLVLSATGGLGTTASEIRLKLVDSSVSACSTLQTARTSSPLDGEASPGGVPTATSNVWSNVRFDEGGMFKLCYRPTASSGWELLAVDIVVRGGNSKTDKVWCLFTTDAAWPCKARLLGTSLSGGTTWLMTLLTYGDTCGVDTIATLKFVNTVSQVALDGEYEIHDFGVKKTNVGAPESYTVCYCPGYDSDSTNGICHSSSDTDFIQLVGTLILIQATILDNPTDANVVAVYPTLRFTLQLSCGNPGMCAVDDDIRYKIVGRDVTNDKPYYDSTAGCRTAVQAATFMAPTNCDSAISCSDTRDDSPVSATNPLWTELQIDGVIENKISVSSSYDVCYCDGDCVSNANWFKIGSFDVNRFYVQFLDTALAIKEPHVNKQGYVKILGSSSTGSWTTTGDQAREMKILPDNDGLINKKACLDNAQSSLIVSGHSCSSLLDCDSPVSASNYQLYGGGAIKFSKSGWMAVCYCDKVCNEQGNWAVVGRLLVLGPLGSETWVFAEALTFKLTIHGWGLSSNNYIRIIDYSNECGVADSTQSANVKGPVNSGALLSGTSNMRTIAPANPSASGSIITFGTALASVAHGLKDGDYIQIENAVETTTGKSANRKVEEEEMINTSHEVAYIDEYSIRIPLSFPDGSYPAYDMVGGTGTPAVTWSRNSEQDYTNIMSLLKGEYKVCWSESANSLDTDFVAQAGTLVITEAPAMTASLSLVTIEADVPQPIIISFTTGTSARYSEAANPIQLKIVFTDPSYLEPRTVSDGSIGIDSNFDELSEAKQHICGKYFNELWSSDPSGFPMPQGCYLREDNIDPAVTKTEFYMLFHNRNGLKASTRYEIVMHATAREILTQTLPSNAAVQVWVMDDVIERPLDVIELGKAAANRDMATGPTSRASGDPTFHSTDGFVITGGTDGLLELTSYCINDDLTEDTPDFERNCQPCRSEEDCGNTDGGVCGSGGVISAAAESVVGGSVVGAGGEDHVNVVKLTIPAIFDPVTDVIQHTIHIGNLRLPENGFFPETITAELLRQEGAGPHYWSSVATGSSKVWIQPTVASVSIVGRAGDGNEKPFKGDMKNELYFRIVTGFNVYAATRGDAELTFFLPPGYKCAQTGSSCATSCIPDNYVPDTLSIFKDSGTGEYLMPSYRGQLGQEVADMVNEAEWSTTESAGILGQSGYAAASCRLTFQQGMVLYGNTVVYMGITVDNPSTALQQSDATNVWTFEAHQKGSTPTYDKRAQLFTLTQPSTTAALAPVADPSDFSANVAVLGKLSEEVIIPTNFAAGAWNELQIFFKTEQECGTAEDGAAQVWVEAPAGFDFTNYCALLTLDDNYFVPEPAIPTRRLPVGTNIECRGAATAALGGTNTVYNSARVTTTSRILGGQFYAFSLQVQNAAGYEHNAKWSITTYTKSSSPCDRSFYNVRMNPKDPEDGSSLPWAVYQRGMHATHFAVTLADLRPAVLETDLPTDITIFPIIVQRDTKENFRIVAPGGYRWEFTAEQFKYRSRQVGLAEPEVVEGTDADLPLTTIPSRPIVEPFNELIVAYLSSDLIAGSQYGIKTKIRVPRNTPTASSNVFILEFGFDETTLTDRSEAGVADAPPVQALINGEVTYRTSVAGAADNELCFRIQTITPIVRGGGLVIEGPTGFIFERDCVTLTSPGFMALPTDSYCRYEVDETAQDTPVVTITAGVSGIGADMYKFCLAVQNPSTVSDVVGTWTFHSYEVISEKTYLDYSTEVPGFLVKTPMHAYRLVEQRRREACGVGSVSTNCSLEDFSYWLTGRNDRPGIRNELIFSFALTEDSVDGELVVTAPTGFEFDYECEVVTDSSR
ncbi:protein arginine methyltransferase 10, partial [Perkinsus olseni]